MYCGGGPVLPTPTSETMEEPRFTSETKAKRGTSETSRRWVFTLNNYTDDEVRRIANYPDWIRWIGYGKEVAPTTGTPHLQGFIVTWDPVRMTKFKLFLRRARFAMQIASFEENLTYCNKEKNWIEFGERPQQGRRNDILGVKRRLDEGDGLHSLMTDESFFSIVMRNERSLTKYAEMQRYKRMCAEGYKKPEVHIRVGPKGTGKTYHVYQQHGFENVFAVPDVTGKWHDGYMGQSVLLFDDVDISKAPEIEYFKHITDGYPRHYPVKGGFVYIRPTHIYITSNHQPSEWWPGISPGDWNAIKRRISTIRLVFKQGDEKVIYDTQDGVQRQAQFEEEEPNQGTIPEDEGLLFSQQAETDAGADCQEGNVEDD